MQKIKTLSADSKKGFTLLAGINRPVSPGQVTKLANSLNKMGCIRPVIVSSLPFIGPGKYIIDGQHLYHALMRNNMDTPYIDISSTISSKRDLVESIALLNASSKSWSILDYVVAWKSINANYVVLEDLYNIYDFDLTTIGAILHNSREGGTFSKTLKSGRLNIHNLKESRDLLDCMTDVMTIIPRCDRWTIKSFLRVYVDKYKSWGKQYNHKKFLAHLSRCADKFKIIAQDPEEIAVLLEQANK